MAATRRRGRRTDDTEFEILLADALAALLPANQTAANDNWSFLVEGPTLRIIRTRGQNLDE